MEVDFPKLEEQILRQWKEKRAFETSVKRRTLRRTQGKKAPRFVFYEGPPTANGRPGFHHVLARVFKDIVCRYKTMRGFLVERKGGWDTHGLPVELQIEKKLGLKSKKDIEKYGIAKFNAECKKSVWEFKKEWEDLTERIGFWLDLKNPYITYETNYIESLWWIIKQFWQKGLLYKDYKVVPYCPRCGTPLSSHEMAQGYRTVTDRSVTVKFLISNSKFLNKFQIPKSKIFLLAWTTTCWTLPGNVALAVGKDIQYAVVQKGEETYILAKNLLGNFQGEYQILKEVSGKDLEGIEYEPLFDSLKNQPLASAPPSPQASEGRSKATAGKEKKHYVALGDFVSTEEGTGIVHTAVMYGEDDYKLGQKLNLPKKHTVDEEGKFNALVPQWQGVFVKDAEPSIIEDLKKRNLLFKEELYEHEYPFCWRCSTPLLYYAKESWFVNMQKVKEKLIANNQKINWVPSHIKEGRFGEWLKEVKDWAFSRERYWGTPLPIWECQTCGHRELVGSKEDLLKQKYSTNAYYILRHGHSTRQQTGLVSSFPEKIHVPLTLQGVRQITKLAKNLKKRNIDLICSSDLLRTKQTAEIIAKELGLQVMHDERLRELDTGIFNGKHIEEFGKFFRQEGETRVEHYLRRFSARPPEGENWLDVQKRVVDFLFGVEEKYKNKTILIVSHEIPLSLLEGLTSGFSREEFVGYREKKAIKVGELRKLIYRHLPYNDEMELDFHRPYVDEVEFYCPQCQKGKMKRVKEVVDVWFDSGTMPFAQAHWPFHASRSKLHAPRLFPADYICEAIDQTRGWFYTLLAVSTLLGYGTPYKNVISLGHILDEKGEKMSKSKGNVVNPWEMIKKYGVDAIRWYFFTASNPGDPKFFAERDLQETVRRFLLPLWNSSVFYKTYVHGEKYTRRDILRFHSGQARYKTQHVLDRWIMSRLNAVVGEMAKKLDDYDVTGAARTLEDFVVNDISLWYIRRSRARFQNPVSKEDFRAASLTLQQVLTNVCVLAAPFIPFLSDSIFARIMQENEGGKKKVESVHWQDWPKSRISFSDRKLEENMRVVRDIAAKGLAERAKAGIKVRQPLQKLKIKNEKLKMSAKLLELLKEEINVKEVIIDPSIKEEVELDATITTQLKREGMVREIIRHIQDMRKKAGYQPKHRVSLRYDGEEALEELIREQQKEIKSTAGIREIFEGDQPDHVFDVEQTFTLQGQQLWLGIKKA